MWDKTKAAGDQSVAMGSTTSANSWAQTSVGSYNTDRTATNTTDFNATDPAFVVGIGSSTSNKNDGLVVYKDGTLELDKLTSTPPTTTDRLYAVNGNLHYNGLKLIGDVPKPAVFIGKVNNSYSPIIGEYLSAGVTTTSQQGVFKVHNIPVGTTIKIHAYNWWDRPLASGEGRDYREIQLASTTQEMNLWKDDTNFNGGDREIVTIVIGDIAAYKVEIYYQNDNNHIIEIIKL